MRFVAAAAFALLAARVLAQDAPPTPPASPAVGPAAAANGKPVPVDPKVLQKQADDLRDSVADMSVSPVRLHADAGRLFTNVQTQTPVVRFDWRPVERESVDGEPGTVKGMLEAASQRFDQYRLRFHAPPPPDVLASAQTAQTLDQQKRASFDKKGQMAENQMGVFRYDTGALSGGIVELNQRMALIATRIGQAFAFATLVHEATHARDRAEGKLSPEHEIDAEVNAFRVQYLWLTTMDPTGMRLVVLRSTLNLWLQRHPDDQVTAMSIKYLDHLISLSMTEGKEDKLRDFVEKLGYEDGDRPAPPAKPSAPAPSPAPVRA